MRWATAPLGFARPGYAAEDNTIRVALVGCGGRGAGAAANALSTKGPTRLVALADVFPERVANSFEALNTRYPAQVDAPPDRRSVGFDAYKKAIDAVGKGGLVLLNDSPLPTIRDGAVCALFIRPEDIEDSEARKAWLAAREVTLCPADAKVQIGVSPSVVPREKQQMLISQVAADARAVSSKSGKWRWTPSLGRNSPRATPTSPRFS